MRQSNFQFITLLNNVGVGEVDDSVEKFLKAKFTNESI